MGDSAVDIPTLDATVMKYLNRAGLDPRCTPRLLRSKTEEKMGLTKNDLEIYKPRIKKLIVKWWKETHSASGGPGLSSTSAKVSAPSPAPAPVKKEIVLDDHGLSKKSEEERLEIYKSFKKYAKCLERADLIQGLGELETTILKIQRLLKRLKKNGFDLPCELSSSALEKEVETLLGKANKPPPVPGIKREREDVQDGSNISVKKEKVEESNS